MAARTKTREITISDNAGTFNTLFRKFTGETNNYDLEGISALRKLLSNERAKLLHVLKFNKPGSIYELAKLTGRDFKSVSDDIKLLERFGFIEMVAEKSGKRKRLKPILVVDSVTIHVHL